MDAVHPRNYYSLTEQGQPQFICMSNNVDDVLSAEPLTVVGKLCVGSCQAVGKLKPNPETQRLFNFSWEPSSNSGNTALSLATCARYCFKYRIG